MSNDPRILPESLVELVENFVDSEQRNADTFSNREVLDESGVYSLHTLAAEIYAAGWVDGERASARRADYAIRRIERAQSGSAVTD